MMQGTSFRERVVDGREIVVYVCWGGQWDGGVDGRRTYVGGRRACSWISQTMRIGEIWKVLEKEMGESISGHKVWYSLQFDRSLLMPFVTDEDIMKLVRGNDTHAYLYVDGEGGPSNVALKEGGELVGGNGDASLPIMGGVQRCVNEAADLVQRRGGSPMGKHIR